jgi:predicted RNase H-like HicB family nuclease
MKLNVIVEQLGTNWCAYTPDEGIGAVVATADSRNEVIEQFRSILEMHLEVLREDGKPAPNVSELVLHETMPFKPLAHAA